MIKIRKSTVKIAAIVVASLLTAFIVRREIIKPKEDDESPPTPRA